MANSTLPNPNSTENDDQIEKMGYDAPSDETPQGKTIEEMGYNEATTPAERALEIEQSEQGADQGNASERMRQNVQDIKDFSDSFKKKEKPEPEKKPETENSQKTDPISETPGQSPSASSAATPTNKPQSTSPAGSKSLDRVKAAKEKASEAKDKLQKGQKAAAAVGDIKENGVDYAKEIAKEKAKEAVKKAAKQALNKAKQAAAKAVRQVATKLLANPYVLGAIGIILLVVIIIAVVFSFAGLGGQTGGGPAVAPSNDYQRSQATLLAALSGDTISQNKTVLKVQGDEKERYDRILKNAQAYNPTLADSITAKNQEFTAYWDQLLATNAKEARLEVLKKLRAEMAAFEATLPFGSWIAKLAEKSVGERTDTFCRITKADANVGCASFTSTILYDAGTPNPIVPAVDQIWRNTALRIIIDRPASKSSGYYQENVGKLKPGDIIFWGDGACSAGGSVLFDHVGFYVGDNQAVDTSSSAKMVMKRSAADRGSCRVFNGAKRYGSD
jgi:hypothetical protein